MEMKRYESLPTSEVMMRKPAVRSTCKWSLAFLLVFSSCAGLMGQAARRESQLPVQRAGPSSFAPVQDGPTTAVSPANWSQLAELTRVPTRNYNYSFSIGNSVAIAGDTIVTGGLPGESYIPAAFIFVKPSGGWNNMHPTAALSVLTPTGFASVAIAGDTVVVGNNSIYGLGSASVFVKPAVGWTDMTPTATLTSSDSTAGDEFGGSVSISGNTIVVGADGVNSGAGAAYIFVKPAGGWTDMTQSAKLTASDGQPDDYLGLAASISGNTIALGTYQRAGQAYVFVEPPAGWVDMTETAKLTIVGPKQNFFMGSSISTDGDTVLAGAPDYDNGIYDSGPGGAYLYVKPLSGWTNATQTAKLMEVDRGRFDEFGSSVLIKGKTAVVGARNRTRGPNSLAGGVYVFTEPSGGWTDISGDVVLTGSNARHFSPFGASVDLDGNTLVVGTPAGPLQFQNQGTAYVFGLP
jgi:FG-GAP repeat